MKLSNKTIQLLKNFSVINPGIIIKKGSGISTIAPNKTLLAKASIEETFDQEFAIHDLSKFLGVLSFLNSPDINLHGDHMTIEEGLTKVTFRYGNPSLIASPPDKNIAMTNDVEFKLSSHTFQTVMKAQGSMQLPEIAVTGDDSGIFLSALDSKNASGDNFSIQVGDSNGHTFKFIFSPNNLKFISTDYDVAISAKGLMYLKGDTVEYWVPAESNSNYN